MQKVNTKCYFGNIKCDLNIIVIPPDINQLYRWNVSNRNRYIQIAVVDSLKYIENVGKEPRQEAIILVFLQIYSHIFPVLSILILP